MARFYVPFSREEYGHIYFDSEDSDSAYELVKQMEQGMLDFEDLPNVYVKVYSSSESVDSFDLEAVEK
jgi:hypothetical protein